ncbi:hypothetical protein BU23DRAFT_563869 [Bimuria novae-zelandiae CBS 107.79]|uniref:Uncharacterized protein n=1 Tax=Bimuria novae-zelandiae CBS 107.79 TaxID=1447943 RepID=A0A6A5VPZ9_9PLEO|nr:hypothetical protein BU23DRAFT_563869 [Bimuria novae-zelandiae CBS 107.79]
MRSLITLAALAATAAAHGTITAVSGSNGITGMGMGTMSQPQDNQTSPLVLPRAIRSTATAVALLKPRASALFNQTAPSASLLVGVAGIPAPGAPSLAHPQAPAVLGPKMPGSTVDQSNPRLDARGDRFTRLKGPSPLKARVWALLDRNDQTSPLANSSSAMRTLVTQASALLDRDDRPSGTFAHDPSIGGSGIGTDLPNVAACRSNGAARGGHPVAPGFDTGDKRQGARGGNGGGSFEATPSWWGALSLFDPGAIAVSAASPPTELITLTLNFIIRNTSAAPLPKH